MDKCCLCLVERLFANVCIKVWMHAGLVDEDGSVSLMGCHGRALAFELQHRPSMQNIRRCSAAHRMKLSFHHPPSWARLGLLYGEILPKFKHLCCGSSLCLTTTSTANPPSSAIRRPNLGGLIPAWCWVSASGCCQQGTCQCS